MNSKSRVLTRMNGRASKYPLSAQTVPLEVALRNKLDPAQAWPGAPPNFGQEDMPHIFSFVGRYGMVANAYMHADEALMHSTQNAEIMRNEPMIMECIEARMRCVSLLNWHIQPVDNDYLRDALDRADSQETAQSIRRALQKPKSDAEFIADKLTSILKHMPNFMKFRYALMDAIWYGKYATVQTMGTRVIGGKRRIFVRKWEPRHGDKLIFRYSDGDFEHDPEQVGIRIGPAVSQYDDVWTDYAGFERRRVDPTQHGLVYWFDGQQRKRMCVHKHIIEDADFMRPEKAGSINGVGIRSRIYWTWWAYQESLKLLMEYIERSALGIEIWKYPAHDPKAKERTEAAAKERGSPGRSCVLVPVPTGEYGDMYGVEIVEPGLGGIGELQNVLQTFFGHKIKRYILGQTLTSEADATGLGSGVADAHLATFHDIVRFDGLNLEETLTTDLIRPLQLWNFPGSDDIYLRFVIDTESPDAQERIAGYQAAWAMGLKIRTEDMYDALGAAPPSEGEEFLDNPGLDSARISNQAQQLQMEQMQMQMQMQAAQPQQVAMAPFPTSGGVPGDGDGDGLAADDDAQLFTDERGDPTIQFGFDGETERYAADDFSDVPTTTGIVPTGQVPQPAPMPPLPKAIRKSALVKNVAPEPVAQQPAKEKRKVQKLPALPYHPDQLEENHWKLEPIRQEVSQEPVYPEHARSSVKYFDGSHDWNPLGRKPSGQVPAINLAQELDRHAANNGGRLDLSNEQHMQVAADAMHEDVMYALKSRKGKITGWYDRSMKRAMKYARKMFPEIQENKDLETVMKLAMAISSGGTDVMVNFRQACKQMHHYLMTGQFNEKLAGGGSQQQAIQESFARANEMLRNQSLKSMKKWLLTKKKVGEWRAAGVHMKDELVDHEVYGSNIFGAKIGAFFANLHGKYEPVTMDRWFMRTVNRIRGGLSSGSEMPLRTNAAKIYNYFLYDKNPDPRYLHGYTRKQLMEDALKLHHTADISHAPKLVDWIEKRFDAFEKGKFSERNYLNNAARNLNSALNIEQIVPASGSDRYHMRKLVEKVQAKLADQGISISNAELQALLWYHEKQLFYHLGYRSSRGESKIAFDEAAKMHHDLTHITGPTKPKEVEPFHWQKALQERLNRRFGNV